MSAASERIEAAKASRGRVWGGGVPLHSRLEGIGERRELPQQGLGYNSFLAYFRATERCWWR